MRPHLPCGDDGRLFGLVRLAVYDAVSPLHAVGPVGRIRQHEVEEAELVGEQLHVRVVLFRRVEDEVPFAVEGFQVRLDTCRCV